MLVSIDDAWCCAVPGIEGFTEEPFCSSRIPLSCEETVQRIPLFINSSIQPLPSAFDLHIDFIDPPRVSRGSR